MMSQLSEIQIIPIKPQNGLVGFASFVFNGCFYLGSIGIYTRPEGGYRLTYPTKKGHAGSLNIFHPINKEIASQVESEVISRFEKVMNSYDRHGEVSYE